MPMVSQPPKAPQTLLWSMAGVKLLVIVLFGFLIGAIAATGLAAEADEARNMTAEEYAAGFEEYKSEAIAMSGPWMLDVLGTMFFFGLILVFYEVVTWALGWLVAQLFKPKSRPYVPPSDSSPFESY